MNAISLWQPWATLIAIGAKTYETRGWIAPKNAIGKDLIICAAKTEEALHFFNAEPFTSVLTAAGFREASYLPRGRAVCVVTLAGCWAAEDLTADLGENERHFGDFRRGRFCWRLENLRRFKYWPSITGRQGMFDLPDSVVRYGLGEAQGASA